MFGLSDYTLQTLTDIFRRHAAIDEVILYGSRAFGNFRAGSDIDLTLHAEDAFGFRELAHLAGEFDDSDMPYLVDVCLYRDIANDNLRDHIRRVGKTLYKKRVES
ncbi:hypothetical protein AGMMS49959_17190 [Planctomycetales bacterium]|nr:hypothetical protein AGMMS49959_17190 [Planctomycetales bacterium]